MIKRISQTHANGAPTFTEDQISTDPQIGIGGKNGRTDTGEIVELIGSPLADLIGTSDFTVEHDAAGPIKKGAGRIFPAKTANGPTLRAAGQRMGAGHGLKLPHADIECFIDHEVRIGPHGAGGLNEEIGKVILIQAGSQTGFHHGDRLERRAHPVHEPA